MIKPALKNSLGLCYSIILVLSFTMLAGCGDSSDSDGGSVSSNACAEIGYSKTAKVVNGTQCPISSSADSSSVVRVEIVVGGTPVGVCTGTVISPTAVLTAAHCFAGSSSRANVIVTSNGNRQTYNSRSVTVHPGFTVTGSGFFLNDAAVIITNSRMNAPVAPLLLGRSTSEGEESVVAGYGQTSASDPTTQDVYAGNAIIRDVTNDHVRIDFKSNEAHPCRGDSGGALFVENGGRLAIAGVVSQSDPSVSADTICKVGDITLYTNIQNASVSSFVLSLVPDAAVS
jgi:secreted trypsin-like serine protease